MSTYKNNNSDNIMILFAPYDHISKKIKDQKSMVHAATGGHC